MTGAGRRAGLIAPLAAAALIATAALPGLSVQAHATDLERPDLGRPDLGRTALRIAAAERGAPYAWGAAGPRRFDCSGLVQYAFRRAGRRLPRTAQAQYYHVRHISRGSLRPGDLVFFHHGGSVYHVGIYDGRDQVWVAPHRHASVRRERIWTSAVWYGRVG